MKKRFTEEQIIRILREAESKTVSIRDLVKRLEPYTGDQKTFRPAGMEVTGELCERLIAEGVPGIHFYSLNRSTATTELVERLGLAAHRAEV